MSVQVREIRSLIKLFPTEPGFRILWVWYPLPFMFYLSCFCLQLAECRLYLFLPYLCLTWWTELLQTGIPLASDVLKISTLKEIASMKKVRMRRPYVPSTKRAFKVQAWVGAAAEHGTCGMKFRPTRSGKCLWALPDIMPGTRTSPSACKMEGRGENKTKTTYWVGNSCWKKERTWWGTGTQSLICS